MPEQTKVTMWPFEKFGRIVGYASGFALGIKIDFEAAAKIAVAHIQNISDSLEINRLIYVTAGAIVAGIVLPKLVSDPNKFEKFFDDKNTTLMVAPGVIAGFSILASVAGLRDLENVNERGISEFCLYAATATTVAAASSAISGAIGRGVDSWLESCLVKPQKNLAL